MFSRNENALRRSTYRAAQMSGGLLRK